ncbi:MAG: AraC family transcriptional regulator [Planctomycetota bacterium]|jgi:AraC-like DNA-binding protein/mannose-6-phosphate isomerase-like protein (cupin superfamily)|nr:AraC family transcriptional regulator [Planctomycetota bacterium]
MIFDHEPSVNTWRWVADGSALLPWVRASRWDLKRGANLGRPHRHDYFEVFWIEAGAGEHWIDGELITIGIGDCFFMRPQDAHTLLADASSGLTWTNVSFPARAERGLRERYAEELGWWPWRVGGAPHHCRLASKYLPRMKEIATSLPIDGKRRLDLDWFVSTLLRYLDPPSESGGPARAPAWLQSAVGEMAADPARLELGGSELVRRCGRCSEHVNRSVRQFYGMSTTELVRHLRLEHAARQLRFSHDDILDIALGAGFNNLSYFYRCFRGRYGTTPRKFRLMRD